MEWQIGDLQRSAASRWWLGDLAIESGASPAVDGNADPVDPVEAGPAVDAATVVPDPGPVPLELDRQHLVEVHVAGDPDEDDVVDLYALGLDRRDHDGGPRWDQRSHRVADRPAGHRLAGCEPRGKGTEVHVAMVAQAPTK